MNIDLAELLTNARCSLSNQVLLPFPIEALDRRQHLVDRIGSVDLSLVAGTGHPDYAGRSWLQLLGTPPGAPDAQLKHLDRNLRWLRENPSYYQSATRKKTWAFRQYGGKYYVDQGNHRTVIARFLFELNGMSPVVHGLAIQHYD